MKNILFFTKKRLATAMAIFSFAATAVAQCVIPIVPGQSYIEGFESGQMECWTVETTSAANWSVMLGTGSNVVAFQNASAGDEARLVSPVFDMSGLSGASFSFAYAMMALYPPYDELTVSYRTSETDSWHDLGSYSLNDWTNVYEETFDLQDLSSTYQISFLGHCNGGYYIFIDNIEITSAGGCARPVNLEASEITAFSALLGWSTTGNEENWTIELNGHPRTVEEQPFFLDDLMPQTEYTLRVKANCGTGLESEWSYPISFKTLCDVITITDEEPYFDDFEASEDFLCWHNDIFSGEDGWVIDPGYLILNNTAFFIWLGDEAMLVSAPLDITAVSHPVLEFRHKQPHGDYNADELSVWYGTAENNAWRLLGEFIDITDEWETATFELPEPSSEYYIAFKAKSNNANGVYVDDVRVGNAPGDGLGESPVLATTVSPNPTNGRVTVETNAVEGRIAVFDMMGKQILTTPFVDGCAEIDLSAYANGVYMARISSNIGTSIIKLVKE